MDNLTHSLFGAVLAGSGLASRHGRGTTTLLVVASNIPDLDAVLMLTSGESAAWLRRTHTHCIAGAPLLALGLAVIWWAATRKRMGLGTAFGLALLGVGGHVALDLLNSYGVVALWPFTLRRFELAWVYIIDLAMIGILAAPLIVRRFLRDPAAKVRASRVALAMFIAYVGICATGHARADALLHRELVREGSSPSFTWVFPEALGPHRWRAVARDGDRFRMWLVHVLERDGRMELVRDVTTEEDAPAALAARATPRGRAIERFFKAPVWSVDGRGEARCFDLRFISAVFDRGNPFTYDFPAPTPSPSPSRAPIPVPGPAPAPEQAPR